MGQYVIISGCSGGGKSTVLEALRERGEIVVEEPGRRIVAEEVANGGTALPWVDLAAFAHRAAALSLRDLESAGQNHDRVFFDRGLIDAVVTLRHLGEQPSETALRNMSRFHRQVFMAPPWPEIYKTETQRRHGFDEALAEYDRLSAAYPLLGYEVVTLPKLDVVDRVNFVLATLASG